MRDILVCKIITLCGDKPLIDIRMRPHLSRKGLIPFNNYKAYEDDKVIRKHQFFHDLINSLFIVEKYKTGNICKITFFNDYEVIIKAERPCDDLYRLYRAFIGDQIIAEDSIFSDLIKKVEDRWLNNGK